MANLLRKGNRSESAVPSNSIRSSPQVASVTYSKKSASKVVKPWDVEQIWVESIAKEEATRKQWEQMYGWMADYDSKGNLKPKKRIVENPSRFSLTVPNSRGHDYGWRLQSELGQEIRSLQTRFDDQHRKQVPVQGLGYD